MQAYNHIARVIYGPQVKTNFSNEIEVTTSRTSVITTTTTKTKVSNKKNVAVVKKEPYQSTNSQHYHNVII